MRQSFVVSPTGPGNNEAFNFSVRKALHCRTVYGKIHAKSHSLPESDSNGEKRMNWTIYINFPTLSHGG